MGVLKYGGVFDFIRRHRIEDGAGPHVQMWIELKSAEPRSSPQNRIVLIKT